MKIMSLTGDLKYSFFRETVIFKDLNCEFIIKLFEYFWLSDSTLGTGYLIFEYCHVLDFGINFKIMIVLLRVILGKRLLAWHPPLKRFYHLKKNLDKKSKNFSY